jgi:hypothetical protein
MRSSHSLRISVGHGQLWTRKSYYSYIVSEDMSVELLSPVGWGLRLAEQELHDHN